MRAVHNRRPSSSEMTTSWLQSVRPNEIAVATPVTRPERTERWWVALMSVPSASPPGQTCR